MPGLSAVEYYLRMEHSVLGLLDDILNFLVKSNRSYLRVKYPEIRWYIEVETLITLDLFVFALIKYEG